MMAALSAFHPEEVIPAKAGIAHHKRRASGGMSAWVYIMRNRMDGVLYIGVTDNLTQRIVQHREGQESAFCRRYCLTRLIYAEEHDSIEDAIAREKAMKAWKRGWKIELIEGVNPEWDDLFEVVL